MIKRASPFLLIIIVCLLFFYPFFLKGLVPIPADFTLGTHYPWVDYKWPGYPYGVPVKNPLLADITSLTFPIKEYIVELMKKGILPLWDPMQLGGHPLLANFQSSIFYPLNFIYFITDFVSAWTILIILQPILAAIFMYLLLRHFKLSNTSSVTGGILYAFSGFNVIYLEYNNPGHVSALIPLLLMLEDKFLKKPQALVGGLFSVVLAVQIFAGYPQLTVYTLLLLGIWALFRSWKELKKKASILRLLYLGFYTFIGFGLSAVQLIPGIELLQLSQRPYVDLLEEQFMPLSHLITFLAPDYFGNPTTYNYWGSGTYIDTIGYSGLLTLIMAIVAVINKKRSKTVLFLVISSLVVVLLAFSNPISDIVHVYLIPGGKGSHLNRILAIFNFLAVILAAKGLEEFRFNVGFKSIYKAVILPAIIVGAILAVTVLMIFFAPESKANFSVGLRNLLLPIFLLFLTSILFFLRNKYSKLISVWTSLLIIIMVLEMFRFGWKYEPFFSRDYLSPTTPTIDFLTGQKGNFRISGGDAIPVSMWIPYRLESIAGFEGMYPLHISELLAFMNDSGNTTPKVMGEYGILDHYDSPLLNLVNIKYITALKYDEIMRIKPDGEINYPFKKSNFKKVFEDKSVTILENTSSLPRSFFVTDWIVSNSKSETLSLLNNSSFPLDKKIVLTQPVEQTASNDNVSNVSYLNYSPNKSLLNVSTDKEGFLFVSDTWYPGWKAKVDSQEVPVLLADYSFRAIPVGAGNHEVEMYFDPLSFKVGKYVSIGTLIFLVLSTIVLWKKGKNAVENRKFDDL